MIGPTSPGVYVSCALCVHRPHGDCGDYEVQSRPDNRVDDLLDCSGSRRRRPHFTRRLPVPGRQEWGVGSEPVETRDIVLSPCYLFSGRPPSTPRVSVPEHLPCQPGDPPVTPSTLTTKIVSYTNSKSRLYK